MGDPEEVAAEEEQPKGGKGKLFIIVGVFLVMLIGMGVAAYIIFKGNKDTGSTYETNPVTTSDNSIFIALPAQFTTNIAPDGTYMVTVSITLQVSPREELGYSAKDVRAELAPLADDTAGKTKMPLVSEAIGAILASKTREQYISEVGKQQIKVQIQNDLNNILEKGKVQRVIFAKPPIIQ